MAFQNRTYRAETMNRRKFMHKASVHVSGDLTVGTLFVAGDLTVDGNLVATELVCLGKVTVAGNCWADHALLGTSVEVGGTVHVKDMYVGIDAGVIGRSLLGVQAIEQARAALFKTLHPAVVKNHMLLKEDISTGAIAALRANSLTGGCICVSGSAWIDGAILAETIDTKLDLTARGITVSLDVDAEGILTCHGSITAGGTCTANELICQGDVRAQRVHYGRISVAGTVAADVIQEAADGKLPPRRYKF